MTCVGSHDLVAEIADLTCYCWVEEALGWRRPVPGWTKDRKRSSRIGGRYTLSCQDYSGPGKARHGRFRYLLVEVSSKVVGVRAR